MLYLRPVNSDWNLIIIRPGDRTIGYHNTRLWLRSNHRKGFIGSNPRLDRTKVTQWWILPPLVHDKLQLRIKRPVANFMRLAA